MDKKLRGWVTGLAVVLLAMIALQGALVMHQRRMPSAPVATCNLPADAASASYSISVIPKGDFNSAVAAIKGLFAKYDGELSNQSMYQSRSAADCSNSPKYVNMTSVSLNGKVPMEAAEAFMQEVEAFLPPSNASSSSNNVTYYRNGRSELQVSCANAIAVVQQANQLNSIFSATLPYILRNASASSYDPVNVISSISQQMQMISSQIASANQTLASLNDSIGMMSVNISIMDRPYPQYTCDNYYRNYEPMNSVISVPPTPASATVPGALEGSDGAGVGGYY